MLEQRIPAGYIHLWFDAYVNHQQQIHLHMAKVTFVIKYHENDFWIQESFWE
ncbi:hypothetical protein EMIT079MI2_310002 [Bacillus sp. IT-79MI2]